MKLLIDKQDFILNIKSYLITGATSGIGLELAQKILEMGNRVCVIGRSQENYENKLLKWARDRKIENLLMWRLADFRNPAEITNIDFESLPFFDGVINSAGIISIMPLRIASYASLSEIINVNLVSPIELMRLLLKNRKIIDSSSIIFLSSINGNTVGSKGHSFYAATKAGIRGFVMSLANELSSRKIRVNSVAPGTIKTEMFELSKTAISETLYSEYEKQYPLGFGMPIDVVNLILFLLSENSKWITGQNLIVDGGVSIT